MGWSIGYDSFWKRDIGYGTPAFCDHFLGVRKMVDIDLPSVTAMDPIGLTLRFTDEEIDQSISPDIGRCGAAINLK